MQTLSLSRQTGSATWFLDSQKRPTPRIHNSKLYERRQERGNKLC